MKIKGINYIFWFIMLLFSIIFAATIGVADISMITAIKIILSKIPFLDDLIGGNMINDTYKLIVLNIRLPRIILAVIVGAALSSSGVVFQAVFKNPMADPYILGISSGAALGATLVIISGLTFSVIGLSTISIGAFVGAVTTTFVVFRIANANYNTPIVTLLLAGIAISFFLSAIINLIMTLNHNQVEKIVFWIMGSLSGASWQKVLISLIPVVIGIIVFMIFKRDLNIILMGTETAKNLGVDVKVLQRVLLITASLVTAAAVSVSGIIGFVGLIIPHAVRLIVGPNHHRLLPLTIFVGSIFMIFADLISRIIMQPTELPIGVITALIGAPYFIFLLINNKRKFS